MTRTVYVKSYISRKSIALGFVDSLIQGLLLAAVGVMIMGILTMIA